MGSFLLDNYELEDSIEYSVSRMAEAEKAQTELKMSGIINAFSVLMLLICFIEMVRNRGQVVYPLIVNLCFMWSVLVLGMSISPLIQYRFYFIEYNFLPFVVFLLFRHNSQILKPLCLCVVVFLIYRFYTNLNNVFQFASIEEALAEPFFLLLRVS